MVKNRSVGVLVPTTKFRGYIDFLLRFEGVIGFCPLRYALLPGRRRYRPEGRPLWAGGRNPQSISFQSEIPNPKSQIESVRHFNLSRIGCCGVFKEMIGLIHDVIEPAIKLPAIFLARLAGSVGRHMN